MMLPIDTPTLFAFALTASAIVLTPGPDTLIILRNAIRSGPRVGMATVAGVQAGLVGHTALAVLGVSVLIASTPWLFKSVALAGAAYIAWIGIQSFRPHGLLHVGANEKPAVGAVKGFRDAVFCNLLNPKVILLFLALFPNFVDRSRDDVPAQLITLAVTLIIMNTLWQVPLALAAEPVRAWLKNPRIYKIVMYSTGVLLIAVAAMMFAENLL
mgnify:CR=1 FL=1